MNVSGDLAATTSEDIPLTSTTPSDQHLFESSSLHSSSSDFIRAPFRRIDTFSTQFMAGDTAGEDGAVTDHHHANVEEAGNILNSTVLGGVKEKSSHSADLSALSGLSEDLTSGDEQTGNQNTLRAEGHREFSLHLKPSADAPLKDEIYSTGGQKKKMDAETRGMYVDFKNTDGAHDDQDGSTKGDMIFIEERIENSTACNHTKSSDDAGGMKANSVLDDGSLSANEKQLTSESDHDLQHRTAARTVSKDEPSEIFPPGARSDMGEEVFEEMSLPTRTDTSTEFTEVTGCRSFSRTTSLSESMTALNQSVRTAVGDLSQQRSKNMQHPAGSEENFNAEKIPSGANFLSAGSAKLYGGTAEFVSDNAELMMVVKKKYYLFLKDWEEDRAARTEAFRRLLGAFKKQVFLSSMKVVRKTLFETL